MDKLDITKTKLYITEVSSAVKGHLNFRGKPNFINSRHSDCFVFVLGGECRYSFSDGVILTVAEGDILYLPHRSDYRMDILTECYDVLFCDFFFISDERRAPKAYTPTERGECEGLFRRLCRTLNRGDVGDLQESVALVYKIYAIAARTASRGYVEQGIRARVTEIKKYIDESFGDSALSVASLADRAGVSQVYLRRQFKAVVGVSPSAYITDVRIENAKRLMQYASIGLEECALECGFSSVQYFSRVFKSEAGVTPAAYRKANVKRFVP